METPKLGVASILYLFFIIQKRIYSERVERNQMISFDPLRTLGKNSKFALTLKSQKTQKHGEINSLNYILKL